MDTAEKQILVFYGWWEMLVCLFAFLGLMAIWYHLGRKQQDKGQVWLALSILCWSFSGGVLLLDVYYNSGKSSFFSGSRAILSLLNNLFMLLAMPWFKYLPKRLEQIILSKYWSIIVGVPFIFALLPTLTKIFSGRHQYLISELDVYYSIFTLGVLAWVLWESFNKRQLFLLAVLSMACHALIFVAQLYKLTDNHIDQLLLSAIFKTCLIMIFFALALSWVKDIIETLQADTDKVRLHLAGLKGVSGNAKNLVSVKGIFGETKDVYLSQTHYDLLKKFVTRRIGSDPDWLEIKPKNDARNGKGYDINDYNEIKRLLHALLDGMIGKGLWNKTQHEVPLKNILLERSPDRERKIRLAILPENIHVDDDTA